MSYFVGQRVRLIALFTNTASRPVDPDAVTLRLKAPSAVEVAPVVVRDEAGEYHGVHTVDEAGVWWYRWEGTGADPAVDEGQFAVLPSAF